MGREESNAICRFSWQSSRRHLALKMLSLPNMTCMWLKCTCTLIYSIQPGPAPSYVNFITAWHHFCLLPNTAIECWCPNLWWDPQTMLKVEFHQAGVVCQTSCNMSGYCSVKYSLSASSQLRNPLPHNHLLQVHCSLIVKVPPSWWCAPDQL